VRHVESVKAVREAIGEIEVHAAAREAGAVREIGGVKDRQKSISIS
jgi:hypothetical protein